MNATADPQKDMSGVVVVLLVDYLTQHRAWGWMRLVQGAVALKDVPGLMFVKVMGSGHGGGFGLRPSGSHQGWICLFADQRKASDFCEGEQVRDIISHSREHWLGMLSVTSTRGQWDQQAWGVTSADSLSTAVTSHETGRAVEPIAVLTRGTIRPAKALAFWRYSPAAQEQLSKAPGCKLAMGLGEAPLLRQCTFSLWTDTESMEAYAHSGAHKQAIGAVQKNNYFSESMFVRMHVLYMSGQWLGQSYDQAVEVHHG